MTTTSPSEQLAVIFDGLRRAHGVYKLLGAVDDRGKAKGRATTVLGPPGPDLWDRHLNGEVGLGVVPINDSNACRWGAIDIDVYQGHDHAALDKRIQELGFPLIQCRSKSGGSHLYLFLTDYAAASLVRKRLEQMAVVLGHRGVEIFPKQIQLASQSDTGNWINMPYFGGNTRQATREGEPIPLDDFLGLVSKLAISPDALEAMHIQAPAGAAFKDGPPCLQYLAENRVTAGGRNEALFAMGVYCRMKYPDEWEEKLDQANQLFMAVPLPSSEVAALVKSLHRKSYYYPCNKPVLAQHCQKTICVRRQYGIGHDEEDVGINIGSLTKQLSDPPIWILDVEGKRIELETADLMDQRRFQAKCMERLSIWPSMVKPAAWQRMVREKLATAEEIEAPAQADSRGRLSWYVEQFCVGQTQGRTREELLLGKPWVEGGRHYFRGVDLLAYLERQHFRELKSREVWNELRKAGAGHGQFNIRGKCVQVWHIPEVTNRVQEEADDVDF